VFHPELAKLLPVLYPGAFPNLQALVNSGKPRADLAAILLTGIPLGVVSPNFQNFTGNTLADLIRLNMAIPPSAAPNNLGVVGGDLAGFPNGRRVFDNVVTIELRAVAGQTYRNMVSLKIYNGPDHMNNEGITMMGTEDCVGGKRSFFMATDNGGAQSLTWYRQFSDGCSGDPAPPPPGNLKRSDTR